MPRLPAIGYRFTDGPNVLRTFGPCPAACPVWGHCPGCKNFAYFTQVTLFNIPIAIIGRVVVPSYRACGIMHSIESTNVEKRRHQRTLLRMTFKAVRFDPDGGEVVDTFHMMDISRSGMGAVAERYLYPGQRMVLCLPMTESTGRRSIYATIRRCGHGEGGYEVGLEFDNASLAGSCMSDTALVAA